MKKFFILRGLKFLMLGVIFIAFAGYVTMWLWNAILPDVLRVSEITFFQALGLLLLARLLFGGFRRHGGFYKGGGHTTTQRGQFMRDKWANMSDEERALFKQQWKERCKKE